MKGLTIIILATLLAACGVDEEAVKEQEKIEHAYEANRQANLEDKITLLSLKHDMPPEIVREIMKGYLKVYYLKIYFLYYGAQLKEPDYAKIFEDKDKMTLISKISQDSVDADMRKLAALIYDIEIWVDTMWYLKG